VAPADKLPARAGRVVVAHIEQLAEEYSNASAPGDFVSVDGAVHELVDALAAARVCERVSRVGCSDVDPYPAWLGP
jgi:hypothetical protein